MTPVAAPRPSPPIVAPPAAAPPVAATPAVAPPASARAAEFDEGTALIEPRPFLLRIVASSGGEVVGREFRINALFALIGRGEDCSVVLKHDHSVSRRHARIQAVDDDTFRLADAGSSYGVWVGDRRITEEVIRAGEPFRVGDTTFECRPLAVEQEESGSTRMMSGLDDLLARVATRHLEEAGEALAITGSRPILLDDPSVAYYVTAGKVEVFTVTVKDGRPLGARNHFVTVGPGDVLFGFDLRFARDSGFLGAGKGGTQVRKIARSEIERLVADRSVAAEFARAVDAWVAGMSARLTRDIFPRPPSDVSLHAEQEAALERGKLAKAAGAPVWVEAPPGSLLYIGLTTLVAEQEQCLFPVAAQSWIEPAGESHEALALTPQSTVASLASGRLWQALDFFHQVLCECEFINKRLALVEEFQRLESKQQQSKAARDAALDAIGAVLAGRHTEPTEGTPSGPAEPIVEACRRIGRSLGIKVKTPADARADRTFEDHLGAIASASRFRTRRVVLRGDWWRRDQGPILARIEQTGAPIALLPDGPRRVTWFDPTANTRTRVTPKLASTLAPFGYVFYRCFPPGRWAFATSSGLAPGVWAPISECS